MGEILRMPEVAAGAVEALLSSWAVSPGTPFRAGDVILTVETEKAVVDVEAESDGVLLLTLAEQGTVVEVGGPIAVYGADGESAADAEALLTSAGLTASPANERADEPVEGRAERLGEGRGVRMDGPVLASGDETRPTAGPATPREGERLFASPLARRLAREAGLALTDIRGTGPRGRIRRRDVEAAAAALSASEKPLPATTTTPPQPVESLETLEPREKHETQGTRPHDTTLTPLTSLARSHEDVPSSRLRQAIARRLTESKQNTPHFYLRGSARVDRLLMLRQEINRGGRRVSVNDLVIKAVAGAHRAVPAMNVEWRDGAIRWFRHVDVSVAVAIDDGLVTPVVRDADELDIARLAAVTRDLAGRARERRLRQSELEGGSISVTNLGMYGVEDFAAIINPPQAAILAVGAAREEAVVSEGQVSVATVMRLCVAVDHRPVDGATAAKWLQKLVDLLENPVELLV
ncbi:dihydrolipoamide acetyltransferase family protein [Kribbella sp. NPDC048915]|uniref:dihydrolipoamide acetyltransferase family protein n=1 Tax=Kribbella sp. NPDC048915 TaxID=3155148 RepID=UPI0033E0D2A6